jgi:hypothetical protein
VQYATFATLERWSGKRIFDSGPHSAGPNFASYRFGYYNPDFVRWAADNLVPGGSDEALRRATQATYDRHLRDIARSYYVAYHQVAASQGDFDAQQSHSGGAVERIAAEYMRQIREAGPDSTEVGFGTGPGWYVQWALDSIPTARNWLSKLEGFDYSYILPVARGFWLRRRLDGTDDEFYAGLLKLLRAYDAGFLQ